MSETQCNDAEGDHHQGNWAQGVGGYIEYRVWTTPVADKRRHILPEPPTKVVPIVFLPGIMGSNLRLSKKRMEELDRPDNRSWSPDDLLGPAGIFQIVYGFTPLPGNSDTYPGWLKNASPRERQLIFDPNETEVEYYHYSENEGVFDPEGDITKASDKRHSNVPDNLSPIPPMLVNAPPPPEGCDIFTAEKQYESAAHKARWRGWSEVLFRGAYGDLLKTVESRMNNLKKYVNDPAYNQYPIAFVNSAPKEFGGTNLPPVTIEEMDAISDCWYPVHAMGYNWLKSNGDNALTIAGRIRELIQGYKNRFQQCEQVILVTHSMGGLLARALLHPEYGGLTEDEVLGVYHSAMPTTGAAAAYQRIRTGIQDSAGLIMGKTGDKVTPVMANSPGALELLPSAEYGIQWVQVVDQEGAELPKANWPNNENSSAVDTIYVQPEQVWWRLFNSEWVNPAMARVRDGGGIAQTFRRARSANGFHEKIKDTFHKTNTYASYCESSEQECYEVVRWKIYDTSAPLDVKQEPPETWILLSEDGKGTLIVQTPSGIDVTLKLMKAKEAGDSTVPASRSAAKVLGKKFVHGFGDNKTHYGHQDSYSNPEVLSSTLYSLIKIANQAKWKKTDA